MVLNKKMFFLKRKWLRVQAWILFLTILGTIVRPVLGEYFSVLDQTTVSVSTTMSGYCSDVTTYVREII